MAGVDWEASKKRRCLKLLWKMVRIWIGRREEETHSGIETQHQWIQLSGGTRRRLTRIEGSRKMLER